MGGALTELRVGVPLPHRVRAPLPHRIRALLVGSGFQNVEGIVRVPSRDLWGTSCASMVHSAQKVNKQIIIAVKMQMH